MARVIGAKARELGCQALAIGGDLDHLHLLARLNTSTSIATLVGEVKGGSSHWANFVWRPENRFRWQGSYGAFSVSPNAVEKVEHYVRHQKEHHAARQLWDDWETCFLPDEKTV